MSKITNPMASMQSCPNATTDSGPLAAGGKVDFYYKSLKTLAKSKATGHLPISIDCLIGFAIAAVTQQFIQLGGNF
jgi:hypothetical protein